MKLKNTFFLLIVTLNWACNNAKQSSENQGFNNKQNQETENLVEETTPLFLVTGFGSNKENISEDSLKSLFCEGKIYVLESSRELAEKYFDCNGSKTLKKWQDFLPLAKDNFLILDINNLQAQFKALKVNDISFFESPEKYPFQIYAQNKASFKFDKKVTKLMLTGVTAITRATGQTANIKGVKYLTENIREYFQDADFVHISNEVSFMEGCNSFGKGVVFCSKKEFFDALIDLNANIIELTGNHNRDFGNKPFLETFDWYKEQGMQTFGAGRNPKEANTPLIITLKDGTTIGFIGFNELCPLGECAKRADEPGANQYQEEKAKAVIGKMRNELKVDFIIASVQFGEVYSYLPSQSQAKITKKLIDFGADIVYGSQAHQVQIVEFYNEKIIFQGFGNFIFDQVHSDGVRQGYFLETYFYKGKMIQAIPIFTFITSDFHPDLATPAQVQAIKKEIFRDEFLYPQAKK